MALELDTRIYCPIFYDSSPEYGPSAGKDKLNRGEI